MPDPFSKDRPLRVIHLSYADAPGGAAIGARRSHQMMLSQGVDSRFVVARKYTDDPTIIELPQKTLRRQLAQRGAKFLSRLQKSDNPVIRTFNLIPMGTARFLNEMDADIIQMHWIAADTISISELAKLNKPVVWKLPDMWAFSGTEHYINPGDPERFREGYTRDNRPDHEFGPDFGRLIWNYKRRCWRDTELNIVGPSKWIADCARASQLFGGYRIRHIPNPLDLEVYSPKDSKAARAALGLPQDKRLILFGALHSTRDRRKGFHHLRQALQHLTNYTDPSTTALVILGADEPGKEEILDFDVHYLGTIRDEERLVSAYNAADLFVLPTEADNLPNTIKEAAACGLVCVGFNVGGMPDMVDHLETGYLARPFDADELARGMAWALENLSPEMSAEVRRRAEARHAPNLVAERYLEFYREILRARAERGGPI